MMDGIRSYLLSVIAAAVAGGIITNLAGKGASGGMIRLIAGLFLTFTLIRPVVNIDLNRITDFADGFTEYSAEAVGEGQAMMYEDLSAGIKQATEAYILDKARSMHTTLTVEVGLSDDELPVPESVCLSGNVSPYTKQRLKTLIEEELGIDKEHQKWT